MRQCRNRQEEWTQASPDLCSCSKPTAHMHQPQPSGRRQSQTIRGQEAKLGCSEKELKPEKTGSRGEKLKNENHTKQNQQKVGKE